MNSLFRACPFIFSSPCTGGLNVIFLSITQPTKLLQSQQQGQGTALPTHPSLQGKLKWRICSISRYPLWWFHPNKFSIITSFQNLGGKGRVRSPHGSSRRGDRNDAPVSALRNRSKPTPSSCCGFAGDRNVDSYCPGYWAVPRKMHLISSE